MTTPECTANHWRSVEVVGPDTKGHRCQGARKISDVRWNTRKQGHIDKEEGVEGKSYRLLSGCFSPSLSFFLLSSLFCCFVLALGVGSPVSKPMPRPDQCQWIRSASFKLPFIISFFVNMIECRSKHWLNFLVNHVSLYLPKHFSNTSIDWLGTGKSRCNGLSSITKAPATTHTDKRMTYNDQIILKMKATANIHFAYSLSRAYRRHGKGNGVHLYVNAVS